MAQKIKIKLHEPDPGKAAKAIDNKANELVSLLEGFSFLEICQILEKTRSIAEVVPLKFEYHPD